MKRIYLLCLLLLPCAAVAAKNKISMVTYFPVPYVAYSQVNTEQMDIGLTSSCDMKLGCAEVSVPLAADNTHLTSGTLELNGGLGILGNTLRLGAGIDDGRLLFSNLRIQTGTMQSMNAETMKVDTLKLFDKVFPSCREANSSDGKMEWKPLRLAGASGNELYLVCGDEGEAATTEEKDCSYPEPAEKSRVCSDPCSQQYSQYECVDGTWQESWTECEFSVDLLYQNKASCCSQISPQEEFAALSDPESNYLPAGATPCYKTTLTYGLVDKLGKRCPVNIGGGTDDNGYDYEDIFKVNCLNFMDLGSWCYVEDSKIDSQSKIIYYPTVPTSYQCLSAHNGW